MKVNRKRGSYRILETAVWNTFRRTSASPADRLVFMYLEAGPPSHYTGLFQVHLVDVAEYTGLSQKEVLQSLDKLSEWGLIVYDPSRQLIFVRGMLQRQLGTSTPNENNVAGIVYYVERMAAESPAVEAFISANRKIPEFEAILEGPYPPPPPGSPPGVPPPGISQGSPTGELHPPGVPTRDVRRETGDVRRETKNLKRESVDSEKNPASTTRTQPSSSNSETTPRKSKSETKASVKGKPTTGNGTSTARMKMKGLKIAAKKHASGEWDLDKVSEVLRNDYGYSQVDLNSREVMDALSLIQVSAN